MAVAEEEMIFERRPVPNGLEVLLEQKAADLFAICDQEDKGFVTKRDMQRMRDKLALDPDQLENVFDALDQDHNGYLTLEEFTQGFEAYLGVDAKVMSCHVSLLLFDFVICRTFPNRKKQGRIQMTLSMRRKCHP